MLSEFKKFIMKGNVVELAIAVVVGAAFGAVVSALVADFITPLIAAIGGQPDFSALSFTINNSQFNYGHFLNTLLSFLIISAVVFFLVVTPLNKLREKSQNSKKTEADTEKKCPKCLSTIPKAATKCKYCTATV